MKKIILIILLITNNNIKAQQNLVLNPSFEDLDSGFVCTSIPPLPDLSASNWSSGAGSSPDIFNTGYDASCILNPFSNWSNQAPLTGNGYAGIANHYAPSNFFREYLRGKLSEPLIIGVTYRVKLYVCLGDYSSYGSNNIGVKFIDTALTPYYPADLTFIDPDVNYTGTPFTDFNNWTLFSFIFVPTVPNLDGLLIGNFFEDIDTARQYLQPGFNGYSTYFLIDDVSVYAVDVFFDDIGPICQGETLVLPTVSNNGVEGTWSPAINNQQTTTYTFTPNDPEFPSIEKTVEVNPIVKPTFDDIGPFCDELPTITSLPTTSLNGIEGTWSPAFNPNQTGVYTFLPNPEFCSEVVIMKVIIDKTPVFDSIDPFCSYDLNFTLPVISKNGIIGSWSPSFDPYNSQTYTFTRSYGDCTKEVTLDVVVYPELNFDLNHYCYNGDYFVEVSPSINLSTIENIQWKINGIFISDESLKIKLSDYVHLLQDSNQIEFTITDLNGCIHSKEILVQGDYLCNIQSGISPNGDGKNDYFDLVSFGGVDLKIFNRYGSIVYEKQNYRNEWNGKSNSGKELPSGTYFYQIITNKEEVFTGWIQLAN